MTELKAVAEELVEVVQKAGATEAVAEAMESMVQQVRFSNSEIDAVNSWREKHVALFVAVGNRVIASDLRGIEGLEERAANLVKSAKSAPPSKEYKGIAEGRFKYPRPKFDRKIAAGIDPAKYVHEAITAAESAGANNVGGTFFAHHHKTGIASSGGAKATDEAAWAELSVRAFSQPEASGHAVCCTPRLASMDAKGTGLRAGELAVMAKNPTAGEAGEFDIIVQPLFLGELVQSTSMMMSAMMVEIGLSMFAKKVGKKVASEDITFVDDPTIDSTSRRLFDHEGVPARRNVVIKDGVLKTFLHNTSTARRFKTRTTANAGPLVPTGSSMAAQPVPFHPVIVPGDWKEDELIEDTKRGLYLNNTWYTRYQNYSTGEFSTIPRDALMLIEDGELVGAVKNIRISDNMTNFWKSIDAVGRNPQEVYWWEEAAPPSHLPAVRSRNMRITRSS
ncbi:MAG TPA: TldD/PmbA family protein [Thermoplasmata archaeon]|nr:TldD/PmbA family protein [Thermoplasmata archaeon]